MFKRQFGGDTASRTMSPFVIVSLIAVVVLGMLLAYLVVQAGLSGLNSGLNHVVSPKASVTSTKNYFTVETREVIGLVFALAVPVLGIRILADEIFSRTFRNRRSR